jgi:hypothetical protein
MTERDVVVRAVGGSVLAQFADILAAVAPELAGHVQAVGCDADTGRLDVAPDAPAYGTQLRWIVPKLITVGGDNLQQGMACIGTHHRREYTVHDK